MLENATIARPYAQAAFEQAQEDGQLAQWSDMLHKLGVIVADKQMRQLIHNPNLSDERLTKLVLDIVGNDLSKTAANFIRVLVNAGRLVVAGKIAELFEQRRAEAEGTIEIEVITAYSLSDEQKAAITEAMAKKLGKKVEIRSAVDQTLIGGAVIRAGDSVIDASLKGRLADLKNIFAN